MNEDERGRPLHHVELSHLYSQLWNESHLKPEDFWSESTAAADTDTIKPRCETSTSNPTINNTELRHRSVALQTKSNGVYEEGETTRTMLGSSRYQVFENTTVGETKRSVFVRAFLKLLRLYNNNKW